MDKYWAVLGTNGLPLYVAEYTISADAPEEKIWVEDSSVIRALSVIRDGFTSKEKADEEMIAGAAAMLCAQIKL